MGQSIGLVELKSIPVGIETTDDMLKAASVELLLATPICPGKYIIIVEGNVGAVKSSVKAGIAKAETFLVGHHIINNVHESLPSAISGTAEVANISALGIIETISALTAVTAGDIAAKASNVRLIEIRIARGLGGKGFLIFTGEISAVKSAVNSCLNELKETGEITSYSVISSPHKDLIKSIM
ncbi:BMC domain-containing protein [Aminipila butyrica]|uniref:BMC domain-containing protein n=1 Tax=Aminipila butyrica TaxID=433296 RepID=A0A858BUW4_9FIRM|nr:BMC domain-containing protein [Aminipila butyrica]QIB69172.1 BMC domain-containing protein [Aminipila butyrica]